VKYAATCIHSAGFRVVFIGGLLNARSADKRTGSMKFGSFLYYLSC
jgi:hypothetical protein